jgi:hypothetical protein
MKSILKIALIATLMLSASPTIILFTPINVNARSNNTLRRKVTNPRLPVEHLVVINKLSSAAQKAAKNVQQWSNSNDLVWIAIYREGKENYVFYTRGQDQFLIFRTNPEKGGDFTIPKGKLFAINDTMLEKIINKQTVNGTYRFEGTTNGSYKENYITPLVEVDKDGYELPNQAKDPYWALHSPPYQGRIPSEELLTPGNSCIRLKIAVAKFIQHTIAKEILINDNTEFNAYLTRYDPLEFK